MSRIETAPEADVRTNSKPQRPTVRIQDLIVGFYKTHTQNCIQLNENLQGISQDLISRIAEVMKKKVPLGNFDVSTKQTLFALVCGIAKGFTGVTSAQTGFEISLLNPKDPGESASQDALDLFTNQITQKANLSQRKDFIESADKVIDFVFQAAGNLFAGQGEKYGFQKEELNLLLESNQQCMRKSSETIDTLGATIRQILHNS